MNSTLKAVCSAAALTLLLAGCATDREPEFGSSVRHMVTGQTYDPATPRAEIGTVDGQKAAQAVDAYRAEKKASGKGKSSSPSILIPTVSQ